MRMTKVTLELPEDDWIFILDSLVDTRDNIANPIGDLPPWAEGIEQANRLISLIHGKIAD